MPQPKRKTPSQVSGAFVVDLDRPRRVRYSMYAIARFEEETGINFTELDPDRLDTRATGALLWAGLLSDDDELDTTPGRAGIDKVLRMVDYRALKAIGPVLGDAIAAALPERDDEPEANPQTGEIRASESTGSASGASVATISPLVKKTSGS